MKSKNKIAFLGGDLRQYAAAVELCCGMWNVCVWGIDRTGVSDGRLNSCQSLTEALDGAVGVVLPLPATLDGVLLNSPLDASNSHLHLEELITQLPHGAVVVGGRIPKEFVARAEAKGICVRDYFDSEEFQIQNAYTTAEAALSIAMNSLDKNIFGSKIAITGFGRIAKHLVRLLNALGANITVAARKESDLAWARSVGCQTISLETKGAISELSSGYDIIYNTVPHWLFDRDFLETSDKHTFIIDLASVPGGVDICAAKELGANVLWATSLPGKYAPVSAGKLIAECVDIILRKEVSER